MSASPHPSESDASSTRPAVTTILKVSAPALVFALLMLMPTPAGLTPQGQAALAVMCVAVILWATEILHIAVTGIAGIVLLILVGGVSDVGAALYGFSQPVAYFLIGILTLGMAVHRSGLAERVSIFLMRGAAGRPRLLYVQMLFSFAALTFTLPSASTRGAILVHIYEQVMERWDIPQDHSFHKAVMMALGSLNRLGSTALLAGGVTPVVASGLLGDFSWGRWFVLMSVPFYASLIIGGALLFLLYRSGFRVRVDTDARFLEAGPITAVEVRAGAIALVTALLWFTDFAHGLHPAVPALIALCLILMPRIGVLKWRDLEQNLGWGNFIVIASTLSLAHALVGSGAAEWFSSGLVGWIGGLSDNPWLFLLALCCVAAIVRAMLPNIAGYLALVIPVAMAAGEAVGLNPLVCGMAVVVIGDTPVYYPAGSTSGVFIFERASVGAAEVIRFGLIMTVVAIGTLFLLALPYWNLVGQPLVK